MVLDGGGERRGDQVALKERNLRNNKTYVYISPEGGEGAAVRLQAAGAEQKHP
jgi:hypothetical protein